MGARGAAWAHKEGTALSFIRVLQVEVAVSSPDGAAAWYLGLAGGGTDRAGAMLHISAYVGCFHKGTLEFEGSLCSLPSG